MNWKSIRIILAGGFLSFYGLNCTPASEGSNTNALRQPTGRIATPCGSLKQSPLVVSGAQRRSIITNAHSRVIKNVEPKSLDVLNEINQEIHHSIKLGITQNQASKNYLKKVIESEIVKHKGIERGQLKQILESALSGNTKACLGSCETLFEINPGDLNPFLNELFTEVSRKDSAFATQKSLEARHYLVGSLRPQEIFYQKILNANDDLMKLIREKYIPYDGQIPLGFKLPSEFVLFSTKAHEVLQSVFPGTEIFMAGSSVTGVKYTNNVPFDVGRVSDFDIELVGEKIFAAGRGSMYFPYWKGLRSGPLNDESLKKLGLLELRDDLGRMANREVHFIISRSTKDLLEQHPSPLIRLPQK